jgi:putative Mg2+ transporter-C (MgtC) family protein
MLEIFEGFVDIEVVIRLLAAVLGGSAIGLDRFLRRKSAGMRTHAIVALGAAMAVLAAERSLDSEAFGRIAQGLVTGVGFIGAGVILRNGSAHVQGLTTAASIWTCSIFGICCGVGDLTVAATGLVLAMIMLLVGKPFEHAVGRLAQDDDEPPLDREASSPERPGDTRRATANPNKPLE